MHEGDAGRRGRRTGQGRAEPEFGPIDREREEFDYLASCVPAAATAPVGLGALQTAQTSGRSFSGMRSMALRFEKEESFLF
ncbi:unnamed protein product [Calypogeia fissa]